MQSSITEFSYQQESARAKITEVMDWCSVNHSVQGNPLFTLPDPPVLRTGMQTGQESRVIIVS